jgi:hypothetical protein
MRLEIYGTKEDLALLRDAFGGRVETVDAVRIARAPAAARDATTGSSGV